MSRVNRIALKLMTHRALFRREALDEDYASEAMSKFDYKIPFTNLFGKGVYRTVVPLKSPMQKYIEEGVKELKNHLGAKLFDGIDWPKGEAYKVVPPHEKAPPGTPPKVQRTNLGKVLGRLPGAETYLNWWSANQGVRDENGFSVVISRHPLDVLRMSDFQGDETGEYPELESCHSPGGGEWESCINEMKHGGPIAYMVKNRDLDSLDPKQISGRGEIFADPARDIPGIEPLSRLRLRRYTHKNGDFDLALPDTRVYGKQSSDFKEQVMDWARTTQATLIGGRRWVKDEFIRRGGEYMNMNVRDSTLFNLFFQDNLDYGNTDLMSHTKSQDAVNAMRRNEIEQIHNNWEGRFEHCFVSYDEVDDVNDDEEVQFGWDGSMRVEVPQNQFVSWPFDADYEKLRSLGEVFSDNGFYDVDSISTDIISGDGVFFYLNIRDEAENGEPDGYNDFCSKVYNDYDDKYDEIMKVIMVWLYENRYLNPSPARQFITDYEEAFQNFDVEWDSNSGDVTAAASTVIESTTDVFYSGFGSKEHFLGPVAQEIRALVAKELQRILVSAKSTSGYSPGFGPESVKRDTYNLNLFDVRVISAVNGIKLIIEFSAHDLTTQEEMEEIIGLLKVVDRMFPLIAQECVVWFKRYEQQYANHAKYVKEMEEYRNKHQFKPGTFQFDPRQARRRTVQEIFAPG